MPSEEYLVFEDTRPVAGPCRVRDSRQPQSILVMIPHHAGQRIVRDRHCGDHAIAAITVIVRSGRERNKVNENRAIRDYVRRISPDLNSENGVANYGKSLTSLPAGGICRACAHPS